MEKEFECCELLGCAGSRDKGSSKSNGNARLRRPSQLGDIPGFCRLRIWGKLPFFCEIRAPGERAESLVSVKEEVVWCCVEGKFPYIFKSVTPHKSWTAVAIDKELVRLGAVEKILGTQKKRSTALRHSGSRWRLSEVNDDFSMCTSYPRILGIPSSLSDEDVIEGSMSWENRRVPILAWYCQRTGAALLRCSQPTQSIVSESGTLCATSRMTGYASGRSAEAIGAHDRYMDAIKTACGDKLWIADLRPRSGAIYNRIFKGGGWETNAEFQNIWPAQMTRSAFEELRPLATARNPEGDIWKGSSDSSSGGIAWLGQVSKLLEVAMRVQSKIEAGISAIVHCSGGWDRTSQISALAQICLDPYYRTLRGFETLIKKDWNSAGHRFAERCQYVANDETGVIAPIFVQFLDAVYQMLRQRPGSFEFNERLLVFLAEHCYSDVFGDFVHDSDYDRFHTGTFSRTASVWTYVSMHRHQFTNPLFTGTCSHGSRMWEVVWRGPVNVRVVKQGRAPSKKAKVSRQLKFDERVFARQDTVLDTERNEWIRISNRVNDDELEKLSPEDRREVIARATRKLSDHDPPEEEWVCVRDRDGQLLRNGTFRVDPRDIKIWRGLYLKNHFRTRVAHPVARCVQREPVREN